MPLPLRISRTEDDPDDLVERGAWGEVRYAKRTDGAMEAKDWLEDPSNPDAHRFDHLFIKVCEGHRITNTELFRQLTDSIWEFKKAGKRILCFFESPRTWRLTHCFKKQSQKCPRREIERAEQIRSEHLSRTSQ